MHVKLANDTRVIGKRHTLSLRFIHVMFAKHYCETLMGSVRAFS